jgi:hypothetical protein
VLDRVEIANARFLGIEACRGTSATLAEEVPALTKAELNRAQSLSLLIGYVSSALALSKIIRSAPSDPHPTVHSPSPMLLMRKSLDVAHHIVLAHLYSFKSIRIWFSS